jgi:hypothetical protein
VFPYEKITVTSDGYFLLLPAASGLSKCTIKPHFSPLPIKLQGANPNSHSITGHNENEGKERFSSIRENEGGLGERKAHAVLHNRKLQHGIIWKFRGLKRGSERGRLPYKKIRKI